MPSKGSKKPRNNMFTQQRLPSWQPILSPRWVILCFLIITVLFTTIGTLLMVASTSVQEKTRRYDNLCEEDGTDEHGGPFCHIPKVSFEITSKMSQPIYMYYKLTNFYQNHRRYSQSKSDTQLGGRRISKKDADNACSPIWAYGSDRPYKEIEEEDIYNPCGLIAWSMFNDTIDLFREKEGGSDEWICSGKYPVGNLDGPVATDSCKKNGIAWSSDRNVKFRPPSNETRKLNRVHPATYYNESGHVIPSHEDEDFMVWMRTAALPNFRKLYRIITVDLEPGNYYFRINSTYPVRQFGGTKSVVISTTTILGGRNLFLSISYIVVAGISLFLAVAFFIGSIVQLIINKRK